MGSKNYPQLSHFQKFIQTNGGTYNAYTKKLATNYFWSIDSAKIYESLEIFSDLLKNPSLSKDGVFKEVNAVNSEFENQKNDEYWKLSQVINEIGYQDSIFSKFMVGNLETQKKEGLREACREFFEKYYSSDIMTQVVYHNDPLDEMYEKIYRNFEDVPNKSLSPNNNNIFSFSYDKLPFDKGNSAKVITIPPYKKLDMLQFSFSLPGMEFENQNKGPLSLITNLLGHSGKNSIEMFLKAENLVLDLSCGFDLHGNHYSSVNFSITLTQHGLKNWKHVVSVIFKYIKMLKENGYLYWLWEEHNDLANISYRYEESSDPQGKVRTLSEVYRLLDPKNFLKQYYIIKDYDSALLNSIIHELSVENSLIFIISKKFEKKTNKITKYFNSSYNIRNLKDSEKRLFENPNLNFSEKYKNKEIELNFPEKNPFIAKNFDLFYKGPKLELSDQRHPIEIILPKNKFARIFYLQDKEFQLPKVILQVAFETYNDNLGSTTEKIFYNMIWMYEISEFMQDFTYQAAVANISFSFKSKIYIECYNDSLVKFQEKFFEQLKIFHENKKPLSLAKFNTFIHDVKKELDNTKKGQQYSKAMMELSELMHGIDSSKLDMNLKHIKWLSLEEYFHYKKNMFNKIRYNVLIEGNILVNSAVTISEMIHNNLISIFNSDVLEYDEVYTGRIIKIPSDTNYIATIKEKYNEETNNTYLGYWQINSQEKSLRYEIQLIETWLQEKYFIEMRTERQLGYIVHSYGNFNDLTGMGAVAFLVQSNVALPNKIAKLTFSYIETLRKELTNLDQKTFETLKTGMISNLDMPSNTMSDRFSDHFARISDGTFEFNYRKLGKSSIKKLTLKRVIKVFNRIFSKKSSVLEIHVLAKNDFERKMRKTKKRVRKTGAIMIDSRKQFKMSLPLYGIKQPIDFLRKFYLPSIQNSNMTKAQVSDLLEWISDAQINNLENINKIKLIEKNKLQKSSKKDFITFNKNHSNKSKKRDNDKYYPINSSVYAKLISDEIKTKFQEKYNIYAKIKFNKNDICSCMKDYDDSEKKYAQIYVHKIEYILSYQYIYIL